MPENANAILINVSLGAPYGKSFYDFFPISII